jgi:hypothetical protein
MVKCFRYAEKLKIKQYACTRAKAVPLNAIKALGEKEV